MKERKREMAREGDRGGRGSDREGEGGKDGRGWKGRTVARSGREGRGYFLFVFLQIQKYHTWEIVTYVNCIGVYMLYESIA